LLSSIQKLYYIGCSFKFIVKAGVEESIVNAPLRLKVKTQTTQKARFFKQLIRASFKFPLKVGVEESIVNAPLVSMQSKNTNNETTQKMRSNLNR
jgi:hypothetical protein